MLYYENPLRASWPEILARPVLDSRSFEMQVQQILEEVRAHGDDALFRFTAQFDRATLDRLTVTETEMAAAAGKLTDELKAAIEMAKSNINCFHVAQKQEIAVVETLPGVRCWRKSVAIERIGLYIPGGSAPLFSTILMLGVPAALAGCKEIILCTPPRPDGSVDPAILYTAGLVGIRNIFKVGGAQAIGALAFGTESIGRVDKIFGPGNAYVTLAKQLVSKEGIAIDLPAGPSELVILADASADARFVAADLLSQAEHGPDSQVILVSDSSELLSEVRNEVQVQLTVLSRKNIAEQALKNSRLILVQNLATGLELLNQYAPEHLILNCENAILLAEKVVNAGSVFIGNWSPESAGDYASGTNHTLPTYGYARAYSGVSLDSFVKKITFQELSKEGLQSLGPAIETMAAAEQLDAHKNAVSIRLAALREGVIS